MDRRGFFRSLVAGVGAAVAVVATAPRAVAKPSPQLLACLNGNLYAMGGIGPQPRWRNYAANYTPVSEAELIRKMRAAGLQKVADGMDRAFWGPPVGV